MRADAISPCTQEMGRSLPLRPRNVSSRPPQPKTHSLLSVLSHAHRICDELLSCDEDIAYWQARRAPLSAAFAVILVRSSSVVSFSGAGTSEGSRHTASLGPRPSSMINGEPIPLPAGTRPTRAHWQARSSSAGGARGNHWLMSSLQTVCFDRMLRSSAHAPSVSALTNPPHGPLSALLLPLSATAGAPRRGRKRGRGSRSEGGGGHNPAGGTRCEDRPAARSPQGARRWSPPLNRARAGCDALRCAR